jgi:hypothetical protein
VKEDVISEARSPGGLKGVGRGRMEGVGEVLVDRELSKKAVMVVNEDSGKVELQRTGIEIEAQSAGDKGGNESNINPQALSLVSSFDGQMYLLDLLLQP